MAGSNEAEDLSLREAEESRLAPAAVRFASMVKKARERRGLSQTVLAEMAQVSHDIVYRLETGRVDISFGLAAVIGAILNVSLDDAVFGPRVSKRVREAAETGETV